MVVVDVDVAVVVVHVASCSGVHTRSVGQIIVMVQPALSLNIVGPMLLGPAHGEHINDITVLRWSIPSGHVEPPVNVKVVESPLASKVEFATPQDVVYGDV